MLDLVAGHASICFPLIVWFLFILKDYFEKRQRTVNFMTNKNVKGVKNQYTFISSFVFSSMFEMDCVIKV